MENQFLRPRRKIISKILTTFERELHLPCKLGEGVTTNDVFVVVFPGGGRDVCLTSWGVGGNRTG